MKYLCSKEDIFRLKNVCDDIHNKLQDDIISAVNDYDGDDPIRLAVNLAYYVNIMKVIEIVSDSIYENKGTSYVVIDEEAHEALTYCGKNKIAGLLSRLMGA